MSSGLRKRELVYVLCLFMLHALSSVLFSLPLCAKGLAAACDCGTPWTFLLTYLHSQNTVISIFYILWRFSISQNGALWQSIVATLVLPKELYDIVKWESANFLHTYSCKNSLSCHHLYKSIMETSATDRNDQNSVKSPVSWIWRSLFSYVKYMLQWFHQEMLFVDYWPPRDVICWLLGDLIGVPLLLSFAMCASRSLTGMYGRSLYRVFYNNYVNYMSASLLASPSTQGRISKPDAQWV